MSKEQVTAFFQKLQADEALKKQFAAVQADLQQQMLNQLAEKIVALGSKSGFHFTTNELHEMHRLLTDRDNENRELSDAELSLVAGGGKAAGAAAGMWIASILSVGLACGVAALMSPNANSVNAMFSTDGHCQ